MKQAVNTQVVGRPPRPAHAPQPKQAGEKRHDLQSEVLEIGRRYLRRFVGLEPKVLEGNDAEAIHDFRVASRRLQQVWDLLYPKPRSRKIRKLRRVLQRSRQIFSTVRNCDVLIQRVNELLARKRTGHREAWKAFKEHLESLRAEEFQKASAKLGRLNLAGFFVRVRDYLSVAPDGLYSPGDTVGNQSHAGNGSEAEMLDRGFLKQLQLIWEAFDHQVSQSQKNRDPNSLHAVRIATKRLRYLIEVMGELGVPEAKKMLSRLRFLQQSLGDWHDLEVMEQMMAEMVARPRFLRSNIDLAIKIEKLMLKNRRGKAAHERKYFDSVTVSDANSALRAWVAKVGSQAVTRGA